MRLLLRPTLMLAVLGLTTSCAIEGVGQNQLAIGEDANIECIVISDDGGMVCPDDAAPGTPDADPTLDAGTSDADLPDAMAAVDAAVDASIPIDAAVDAAVDAGMDGGTCECPDNIIDKFSGGFDFSDSYNMPGDCPIFGGKFGASLALNVSAEKAPPSCNMDTLTYDSSLRAKAGLQGADHLCKISHNFGIEGSFGVATKECTDCDESTLLYEPNGQKCDTFDGEVKVEVGKTWHMNVNKYKRVTIPIVRKSIGFRVKCGVDANITVDAKVGGKGSLGADPFECGDCDGCVTGSATLGVTGTGKGSCNMFLSGVTRRPIKFGCTDCLIAKVGASVSGEASTGECETNACFSVSGTLGGELPKVSKCFGFRWFHVAGQAGFEASISPTYSSCGGGVKWNPKTETHLQVTSGWGKCD